MRVRRIPGIVGLGFRRVWGRLTGSTPGRTFVSIIGVAAAIGVLVTVTGLSLGLAASGTVASEGVNYWIVPDQQSVGSTPLAYEGASLGSVHQSAAQIRQDDRVDYVTPVAIQPIRLDPPNGDRTYVLALGIVADESDRTVAGVDTGALTPGDPFYADGTYAGNWTGDLVASPGVSEQLDVEPGSRLAVPNQNRSFTLRAVSEGTADVSAGTIPVVVVHLSELQAVTNTTGGDQADQILVATSDDSVRTRLENIYPRTSVQTRSGFSQLSPRVTSLAFAMAVAAGLIALGVGVAFVATLMGLEFTATRRSLAAIQAVGYSRSSVVFLIMTETLVVTLIGGVIGIALGWIGIVGLNAGVARSFDLAGAARFDPLLVPYGLCAAVLVGVLSVGYPLYIAYRTEPLEELTR